VYLKDDFIGDMINILGERRPSNFQKKLWVTEYDLVSKGYLHEISEDVLILCSTGKLQDSIETIEDLLNRKQELLRRQEEKMSKVEKKIQVNRTQKEKHLLEKSYLNMCPHETHVEITDGEIIRLVTYKNTPRVVYEYHGIDGQPSFLRVAKETHIDNLPLPMKGINIIVSHETIKATAAIGKRLLKKKFDDQEQSLYYWLKENNLQEKYKKKIRYLSAKNIADKWPELNEFLNRNIPEEEKEKYLKELKRYTARGDLWAPGPRVRNDKGEIKACKGLINFYGIKDHL